MCNSTSFSDYVSANQDSVKFNAKLEPTTEYYFLITDRTGRKISKLFTTDADGLWEIPKTDLPDGFLAPGNKFKVEILRDKDDLVPIYAIVQTPVSALDVEVKHTDGVVKDFIGGNWDN